MSRQAQAENANATCPAVPIEKVLIYAVINAYKNQDVAVFDMPWAYLSAEMDNNVFMIFQGTVSKLMVELDPMLYQKYILYRNKMEALLYVSGQKALYGCQKNALFIYKKVVGELESHIFEINP